MKYVYVWIRRTSYIYRCLYIYTYVYTKECVYIYIYVYVRLYRDTCQHIYVYVIMSETEDKEDVSMYILTDLYVSVQVYVQPSEWTL